ncbi:MAG: putative porin [Bdellovibrionales bacterium]|nr:putative porin [Bdellovibrionales bacterium]
MRFLIILFFMWGLLAHAEVNRDLNSSVLVAYQDLDSSLMYAYMANQNNRLVQSLGSDSLNSDDLFGFDGDMRFRYMNLFRQSLTHAFQMRVRAGFEGRINPKFGWGFKLASGGQGDNYRPILNYDQDQFVGGFDGKLIWLSGAYLSYAPIENGVLKVGKLDRSPFLDSFRYNPLWDEDLAPEGFSAHYRKSIQGRYAFDLKTSWFFVNPIMPQLTASDVERKGEGFKWDSQKKSLGVLLRDEEWFDAHNKGMFSASAQALMSSNDYDLRTGVSYHNVQTKGALSETSRNSTQVVEEESLGEGASVLEQEMPVQKTLKYNYSMIDLFLQMNIKSIRVYPVPLAVSVQLTQNFGAESNFTDTESFGFVIGGVLGHVHKTGHWNFGYHFFQLPRDVTLSHFVDSDIGGTGYVGHQLGARYFINEDMAFDFKYIMKMDSIRDEGAKMSHQGFVSVLINI